MHKTRLKTFGIVITAIAVAAGVSQAWTAWKAYQYSSTGGVSLASEVGANYTPLRNLLKAGRYKEADEETMRLMVFVARRQKEGWLDTKAIDSFPCQDLRTVDQLWVQNSNGRFGFSIQRQVYNQVGRDWAKFIDQVEWRVNGTWTPYDSLIWEVMAPQGHLPVWVAGAGGLVRGFVCGLISSLEPRLVKSNI